MRSWWLIWRVPVLLLIVMTIWWYGVRPVVVEQGWVSVDEPVSLCGAGVRTSICVIDGDTLLHTREGARPERIRLTGYDAPERDGACEAERRLANTARIQLATWLNEGPFEWNGAEDPPRDQYGRALRSVRRKRADGEHDMLAEVMISSEVVGESGWGAQEVDWCN